MELSVSITFGFRDGFRETFSNSFPFLVKFLFYTDKTESIMWQGLVPRQRVDDFSVIHPPH